MQRIKHKICLECGKEFHPARKTREFCSRQCSSKYRMKQGNYTVSEETKIKMRDSHLGKIYNKVNEERLYGLSKTYIINKCLNSPFPGTLKWPANNPIWNCRIAKSISPKEAWKSRVYITKAVNNLFYIVNKSTIEGKYNDFCMRVKKECEEDDIMLLREVLQR